MSITLSNDAVITTDGNFTTVDSPRILTIEGAKNVRDIGGWETASGKPIKYGLLYRGTELDGANAYQLTEEGRRDMLSVLGIKFDMDLRGASEIKGGALGENVFHKGYGAGEYSMVFDPIFAERVREAFVDLANKDNYPIYMHCIYGRDRTGTICYLLEALLGVSDEDLLKDYELSAFTDGFIRTDEFTEFIAGFEAFKGNTTQERVENYLLSVGVTEEEIANIREIFLGE